MAYRLSTSFLSDVFRSIFNVEKSTELIEPRVFTVDDDPGQIVFGRLNPFQIEHLPFAIINDEVLCKNFKLFSDIDFAVFVDLSLSMLYRWSLTRDVFAKIARTGKEVVLVKEQLCQTKLYALKYLCCAFLYAAINKSFKTSFVPFSEHVLMEKKSQRDLYFPAFVMNFIDEHFDGVYKKIEQNENYGEESGLANAVTRALKLKKRSIVLFISDFLDDTTETRALLFDLKLRHSLLVAVINDPYEVKVPSDKLWRPLNKSWEHTKNIEKNTRRRIILTEENIQEYNQNAQARRNRLFKFLRDEKIPHIDLVTDQNQRIPEKLEKLNLEILQGF